MTVTLNKLEGLGTTVSFWGILIHTAQLELWLPLHKLARLRRLVASWLGRRSGHRLELESLLRLLSHTAVVVNPGRIFLWQLFALMAKASRRHYFVDLDSVARADLAWLDCFLRSWHGTSFMILGDSLTMQVHSDASGTFGCCAITSDNRWLQVRWPASSQEVDILVKEVVLIVVSAAMWGGSWHQCRVFFHSDNMVVVAVIQRKYAKHPLLLHLLRSLYLYAAYFQFSYSAHHLPEITNVAADSLS